MPSLWATLGLNATAFKMGLDRAQAQAAAAGTKIGSALGGPLGHALAGFASVAALESAIHSTIQYGGTVAELSKKLGISTDAVQEWDYALRMTGSSIDAASTFLIKMASARKKALDGSADMIDSFKKLGVSVDDLRSKRLEDIGVQISQAFKSGDPQELVAYLRDVGGRGAGEMIAAFRTGFSELIEDARKFGTVIDEAVVEKLHEAENTAKRVGMQFRAGFAPVVSFLARMLEGLWVGLNTAMRGVVGFVTGGTKGADDLVKEYKDAIEAQKHADKERAKGKSLLGYGIDEEAEGKKRETMEKRIASLKEDLFRAQQENDLKQLTHEEQVQELYRRRALIAYAIAKTASEEGRLNAAIDIEKIDSQLLGMKDQNSKTSMARMDANSLQKIGAYVSDPVKITTLDLAKKSENHLQAISRATQTMANRQSAGSGTTF